MLPPMSPPIPEPPPYFPRPPRDGDVSGLKADDGMAEVADRVVEAVEHLACGVEILQKRPGGR